MKIVLSLIFLVSLVYCEAQKTFAPLGANWKYERHTIDCKRDYLEIRSLSEIEIDGKDCSVLYAFTSFDGSPFMQEPDSLIIWEDSNKVYFEQNDSFYILYDFSLNLGDTFTFYQPTNKGIFSFEIYDEFEDPVQSTLEVTSKDSVVWPEKTFYRLRTFTIDGDVQMGKIISDVGTDTQHIIGFPFFCVASGCGCHFICKTDSNFSYPDPEMCDFVSSTNDAAVLKDLGVYPNPALNKIHIDTELPIESIRIFNVLGELQKLAFIEDSAVNVASLSPGFFFGVLTFKGQESMYPLTFIKE